MKKHNDFKNYLNITPNKFEIFSFDVNNSKILYKEELTIQNNENISYLTSLKKFLDNNIFKIEKLTGKFVENIFIIFENSNTLYIDIGIKKKNYSNYLVKEYLKNSLIEAKDLFRENYQEYEIVHMIVKKYLINEKKYLSFQENLVCDQLALEIQFISISNKFINDLNNILEDYQIKITKYLDGKYVKKIFNNKMDPCEMFHRTIMGYNKNEVIFIPKNIKKSGFFESFFQLFS